MTPDSNHNVNAQGAFAGNVESRSIVLFGLVPIRLPKWLPVAFLVLSCSALSFYLGCAKTAQAAPDTPPPIPATVHRISVLTGKATAGTESVICYVDKVNAGKLSVNDAVLVTKAVEAK